MFLSLFSGGSAEDAMLTKMILIRKAVIMTETENRGMDSSAEKDLELFLRHKGLPDGFTEPDRTDLIAA